MPFLYGLILLLALTIPLSYGLRYLLDFLIVKASDVETEKNHFTLKHPLANINNSRATILIVGGILSLFFSYYVINYKTYTLAFEAPEQKKDTVYVDPLAQIEITEHQPQPKPKKQIAIEVKEVEKPVIDTTELFTIEDETPVEEFVIVSEGVVPVAEPVNEEPVLRADVMPRFRDSDLGFQEDPVFRKFVYQNFNRNKIRDGDSGIIYVSFVIEKDGSLSDIKIVRGINERLDEEVKRIMELIPPFTSPAMTNGVPVRLYFNWPFRIGSK